MTDTATLELPDQLTACLQRLEQLKAEEKNYRQRLSEIAKLLKSLDIEESRIDELVSEQGKLSESLGATLIKIEVAAGRVTQLQIAVASEQEAEAEARWRDAIAAAMLKVEKYGRQINELADRMEALVKLADKDPIVRAGNDAMVLLKSKLQYNDTDPALVINPVLKVPRFDHIAAIPGSLIPGSLPQSYCVVSKSFQPLN